jgi:tetratricopeptide (TPR) repeat protein
MSKATKSIESDPIDSRMTLATVYKHAPGEMNLTDDAIKLLQSVIADQEKLPMQIVFALAYKDLSYVHEQLGEYKLAIEARAKGAKIFPDDVYFQDESAKLAQCNNCQ